MGWFSPIKGHYPSLGQIDKTLPVQTGNEGIVRGMVIEMTAGTNSDGEFKIAADATNEALLYIALQDYKDAQAGMAGSTAFDHDVPSITEGIITIPGAKAGVPAITGLSLSMEGEYETDQFDKESLATASIGDGLTVENGMFKKAAGSTGIVAILTGVPASRWVNNAPAKTQGTQVVRQGANVSVIRFRTK
jgi:hypothetical protein